jgi:hypothetical protein
MAHLPVKIMITNDFRPNYSFYSTYGVEAHQKGLKNFSSTRDPETPCW